MIPDMSSGNIVGYELEFSPVVTYSQIHPTLTATVSGLSPGTKYQFRVAAVTAEGRQPFSDNIYHNTTSKFSGIHLCDQIYQNECCTCTVSFDGYNNRCQCISGWPVVPVQPWSRFISELYLSRIGCSRFTPASRFPWLWVKTLYRPSLLCMPLSAKLINEIMIMMNDSIYQCQKFVTV